MSAPNKSSPLRTVGRILLRFLITVLLTVVLLAFTLYCAMYIIAKGPSPTARDLFVRSVRETSAVGFLADLFFTEEEIAQIEAGSGAEESVDSDPSLIVIPDPVQPSEGAQPEGPKADAWGLVDEDGDGIIIEPIRGEGFQGYMMVVLDPSRVIMATSPESYGYSGYTVEQMVKKYDAVAGINAGGFDDPNGQGNGSVPDSLVVSDGKIYYPEKGISNGFAGFDSNHILHVGKLSVSQIRDRDIRSGVCFGPVLVANGEAVTATSSGVNPRTGIGQRSDGAVLMLVIEGRQITSLGATYQDMTDIFLSFGAVNACNMDGGSSSMMWYEDHYVNQCASVIGVRPLPTTFLVLKEGVSEND